MVWEQEASLIIMLTTTVERGRVSCVLFYLSRCDPPPFTATLFCHEQNRSQLKLTARFWWSFGDWKCE